MDKNLKILLYCIVGLTVLNLVFTYIGFNSNLNKAIKLINQTRDTIHVAIGKINTAKVNIDTVNSILAGLKGRAERSGIQIDMINQQLLIKTKGFETKSDSLKKLIQINMDKLKDYEP